MTAPLFWFIAGLLAQPLFRYIIHTLGPSGDRRQEQRDAMYARTHRAPRSLR